MLGWPYPGYAGFILNFTGMKNIDFRAFVAIPATVVGGEKISAVLEGGSEFGVAQLIKTFCPGVSLGEAVDIADWLVRNSGRSDKFFSMDSAWVSRGCDTAFREAVLMSWQSLCSIELTS